MVGRKVLFGRILTSVVRMRSGFVPYAAEAKISIMKIMGNKRESQLSGPVSRKSVNETPAGHNRSVAIWNKLPQWLNLAHYRLRPHPQADVLDYEPIHLHVTPCDTHPIIAAMQCRFRQPDGAAQKENVLPEMPETGLKAGRLPGQWMEFENFRFLLEQVPAIRTLEFSGKTDPFRNADLLRMVDAAHRFNGAEATVHTDGFLLGMFIDNILKSRLRTLLIHIYGHRPSAYGMMSGESPTRFVAIRDSVARLVARKKTLGSAVEIELGMVVDLHNFRQIPEMIRFAEEMGVDGIRFENYLSPEPGKISDRTLLASQVPVVQFMRELNQSIIPSTRISVTLPTLLDEEMSGHRHCVDPYSTVTVDAEFNVSGCSRQLLIRGQMSKIWDEDFWNSELYQWLRNVHGSCAPEGDRSEVPLPCRSCPRNMPR
jgi:MoaA/NifB/PqqE/SkfB family radical SAM enzyme